MILADLVAAAERHVAAAEKLLAEHPKPGGGMLAREQAEAYAKAGAHAMLAVAYELQAQRTYP